MYRNYKLFPNNYIAYDIRQNSNQFADKYTETEKRDFVKHLNRQANIEDVSFTKMKKMLLEIYANPVESFLSLDNKK